MSAEPTAAPVSPPRRWPVTPWLILALGIVAIAGLWLWPDPEFPRLFRNFISTLVGGATLLLLIAWMTFLSGWPTSVRLMVLGLGAMMVLTPYFLLVRRIDRDGDVMPTIRWVWEPSEDHRVEVHRLAQQSAEGLDLGDLSGTQPTDWPRYQGPQGDGIVRAGPAIIDTKPAIAALTPLWKQPCGLGYASFALVGRGLFTLEQRRADEAVVCYDAESGREVWLHSYPAQFTEAMGGDGPRATPTVADGRVYSVGATGHFVCLDAATGKPIWSHDLLPNPSSQNLTWGMCGSPLIHEDLVVVSPGANDASLKGRGLVAYDRITGEERWHAGDERGSYTSPMLATLGGEKQILIHDANGLAGYDSAGGGERWRVPFGDGSKINCTQPIVVDGERVYISTGYRVGSALVKVTKTGDAWQASPVWTSRSMSCHFNNPVLHQGHVYGLDDGILACQEIETGKRLWKGERLGKGQLLLDGDVLVIVSEKGQLVFVRATPENYEELGRVAGLEGSKTWNCPAMSAGKLYARNHEQMACFDLKQK
jgi:outer membrane protein assembly factor BamB